MIAAWIIRMVAASALIGAGAWLFERVLAARGLPRRGAWVAGLLAVAALPFIALVLPSFPDAARAAAAVLNGHVVNIAGDTAAGGAPAPGPGPGRNMIAGVLWLAATLGGACIYAAGWWRLRSARRAWRRSRVAGASVLVSPGAGPAAVGVLQPAIVVPEWLLAERESVQRLVVLHEAEHLAAGDHRVLALAPLSIVLLPWNAPVWWMMRRLRLAMELDCDGRVLARGVEPCEYGSLLLAVAGRRGVGALSIAMASPRSGLERRIEALAGVLPRAGRARAVASIAAGLACIVVACAVAPTAPLDGNPDEARLGHGLGATDLVQRFDGPHTRWTIDGVPAGTEDVLGLPAGGIAMVRAEESTTRGLDPASGSERTSRTVHVLTPAYVASNPELMAEERVAGERHGLDAMRALLDEPGMEIVIDGRTADAARARSLADEDIAKVEIVRRRSGDDVASAVHIETLSRRID
jgi:hypothetical protein